MKKLALICALICAAASLANSLPIAQQTPFFGRLMPVATGGGGGGDCPPSYANTGGTGNRNAIITITETCLSAGDTTVVDGDTTTAGQFTFSATSVAGEYLQFDFGSGNAVTIDEAKYYQSTLATQGTWQWQGSNDGSSWTDIGSPFILNGQSTGLALTELNGNTTAYRYYRMLGVSGTSNGGVDGLEFEFEICGLGASPGNNNIQGIGGEDILGFGGENIEGL